MPPQIAKVQGAHVTTTCSTRNVDYVTQQLGADVAIDYTQVGRLPCFVCARVVWLPGDA
jgi:NADPH-dependent curcumin reductase CurA